MRNKILPLTLLMSAVLVTGCAANGGHQYRADVYNPSAVNRAQEVRTVEIIAIQPAQVVVDNSDSRLGKILDAAQGQFSITDRDGNTPYIKKLRVVSTVTYQLKD